MEAKKSRGRYPAAIFELLSARPDGATSDEIIAQLAQSIPADAAPRSIESGWGIRAALTRMSKEGGPLTKEYVYRPVDGRRFGVRVYRYKLKAGYALRPVTPAPVAGFYGELSELEYRAKRK